VGLRLRGEGILDHPVEFVHDPESGGWAFRVPSLHITGGAQTEDQAKEMAREAILFALDHPEKGFPSGLDTNCHASAACGELLSR
jgi:hypothetical protein